MSDRTQTRQDGRTGREGDRQANRTDRTDGRQDLQDNRQQQITDRQQNRQDYRDNAREDWQDYSDDYHHGHWDDWGPWGYAAAGTVVVAGAYALGTAFSAGAYATLPCTSTTAVVGGITYYYCGTTWYQPTYSGGDVTYIVVNPPPGY